MNRRAALVAVLLFVSAALPAAGSAPKAERPKTRPKTRPSPAAEVARINARLIELVMAGKYAKCEPLLKRLVKITPKDPVAWYNLACVYSRLGRKDEALRALATAVKHGWRDLDHMAKDKDLDAIRKTPGYRAVEEQIRKLRRAKPTTRPALPRPPIGHRTPTQPSGAARRRLRELIALRREALRHFQAKEYDKARDVIHKILEIQPNSALDWYNLACAHSRLSNMPEAIACLYMAVQRGYTSFRHMERDPDLKALRWTQAYKDLLAKKDALQRARAEKILQALRDKYGSDYICEIDHDRKMVFATNVDRKTLEELKSHLTAYATAQWRDLFTHPFEQYITVVVPKKWPSRRVGGYYNHAARVLVCKSIGMVLDHEFTHAMHFSDLDGLGQRHPIWIVEGLATLFETSTLVNGHAVPRPNHRLNVIQRALKAGKALPLRQLVKLSHRDFMKRASIAYAEARYLLFYLYDKKLLKRWYDTYTDGYDGDKTGARALVKVFGKELDAIEADWKKWVLSRKAVMLRLPANHAYLGISVQGDKDGVRIARIVPRSGAAEAGLKVGDVIVRLDGDRLVDPLALIQIVGRHKVGDEVAVEFRRDGKYHKTTVTLQALPEELSRPRRQPKKPATRKVTTRPAKKPAPKTRPAKRPAPKTRPAKRSTPRKPARRAGKRKAKHRPEKVPAAKRGPASRPAAKRDSSGGPPTKASLPAPRRGPRARTARPGAGDGAAGG